MASSVHDLLQKQAELVDVLDLNTADPKVLNSAIMGLVCESAEVLDLVNNFNRSWVIAAKHDELIKESIDVLFYLLEIFLCLGLSADEVVKAYNDKHALNMVRAITRVDKPVGA